MHIHTSNQPDMDLGFGGYTCNWGLHLCGLYETEAEFDEIVMKFLHQGQEDGSLLLHCPTHRTVPQFKQAYQARYPQRHEPFADPDAFTVVAPGSLYFPDGLFAPQAMLDRWGQIYERSRKNQPRSLRVAAEMSWSTGNVPGAQHLMAYEARLNRVIPGQPWAVICLYDVNKFSGSLLIEILRTHPYVINKGTLFENPFYQEPEAWLEQHAGETDRLQ